jgi:hypothetical protein
VRIVGGGEAVWADGIDATATTAIVVKWVGSPGRSPFVASSAIPDEIRNIIRDGQVDELARYRAVIADSGNPLEELRLVTNSAEAGAYFEGLMNQ